VLAAGGPLAICSGNLFGVITDHYANKPLPAVIVADFFTPGAVDAGDQLGVPVIICHPNPLGLGVHLLPPSQRTGSQLVLSFFASFAEALGARFFLLLRNRQRKLCHLPPMIEQDVWPTLTMKRPMLVTWGLGYEYAAVQSPLLSFVGPSLVADWFEKQSQPILYVAFGTMKKFTQTECSLLFGILERLDDVAVLWSLPAAQQSLLDSTASSVVRFEAFVPQQAVLAHPKVLAFVTHCGANSVSEAILNETPMICCPGMADQKPNAARIVSSGVGVLAQGGAGPGVACALRKIQGDREGFQSRLKKLKKILLSHGGAKRAADIIESIGAVGYDHMVPSNQRRSWLKVSLAVFACLLLCGSRRRAFWQ